MGARHIGKQTVVFDDAPVIFGRYSIVGAKEGKGPFGMYFDEIVNDPLVGGKTWEEGESNLINKACIGAVKRAGIRQSDIDMVLGGDLLSQLMATTFGVSQFNVPFLGLYGACSTMGESLAVAGSMIAGGSADICLSVTSSHFAGAQKQFRAPLDYGEWRSLTAGYTVTGSGAVVTGKRAYAKELPWTRGRVGVAITGYTAGIITDYGIKDSSNMGAAMAPAAYKTILANLNDTSCRITDYDLVVTGDLGTCGSKIMADLLLAEGINVSDRCFDCGEKIFDEEKQDTHAGGSGCGCSASLLCGYLLKCMEEEIYRRILFVPTGALLSPVSFKEGKTIPGIAHAIMLEAVKL